MLTESPAKFSGPTPNNRSARAATTKQPNKILLSLALLVLAEIGLIVAYQFPARYTLELNKAQTEPRLVNFYPVEPDPLGGHRWSQPQAGVFLLGLDAAPTIRLFIDDQLPPDTPVRELKYGLVGQPGVYREKLKPGLHAYELVEQDFMPRPYATHDQEGFIQRLWLAGPVLLFETTPYLPKGDGRQLGVVVQGVEVTAGLSTGRVGLPTLPVILLTAVISLVTATLLSSFKLNWQARSAYTLGIVGGWLLFVAFGRIALLNQLELVVMLVLLATLSLTAARVCGPQVLADTRNLLTLSRRPNRPDIDRPLTISLGQQSNARWLYRATVVVGLFAFAMHLAGFWLPAPASDFDARSFGLFYFARLPWPFLGLLSLAVLLATFPATNNWLARRLIQLTGWHPLAGRKWYVVLTAGLVVVGLITVFCLLFRTRLDYGDYQQIIYKLERLKQLDNASGSQNFLIWREGEILDYALHFLLWRVFENSNWWQPSYTYTVTSAGAGGLFGLVAWLIAASLTHQMVGRILIAGLLMTTGTTLVFMGYVESYTLVSLVSILYVLAAIWAFAPPTDQPISLTWPAFLLGIAVLLHPQAIFLGPSYLVGLLWRSRLSLPKFRWSRFASELSQSVVLGAGLLTGLIVFMGFYNYTWTQWDIGRNYVGGSDQSLFKPLLTVRPGTAEYHPILSGWFWRFQFNLQMLVAPLSLPLLAWLICSTRQIKQRSVWLAGSLLVTGIVLFSLGLTIVAGVYLVWLLALGLALQVAGLWLIRQRLNDPIGLFLATAALYTLLFSLDWNPDLGSKDWDLLSLNGFFTSLLAGYWLVKRLERQPIWLARVAVTCLVAAACLWLAWISYNAFFY